MTVETRQVAVTINGQSVVREVPSNLLLSDFIRHDAGFTGTHVGCEHGVCGACTILLDGKPARSCLMLAAQAVGASIETVESLADGDALNPLQNAFWEKHGLQCGYCTPGVLMSMTSLLREVSDPSIAEIQEMLSGHLCRCTGYQQIIEAVQLAARQMNAVGTP